MQEVTTIPTPGRQEIRFVDVTPRDGEQQEKIHPIMPVEDRLAVFDNIIDTGIRQVEIGHLGNDHDQVFASRLVDHINAMSAAGDRRYDDVKLQVLFGSQVDLTDGIDALEGVDKDRVVAHVYDRASPELRGLATEPYSISESAERVIQAAGSLIEKGYEHFSISGEGTVSPNLSAEAAATEYYIPIMQALRAQGASSININLPDTFGSSLGGEWTKAGLEEFNRLVKEADPSATTSIHVHDDHKSATSVAVAAIEAGFDTVEGTLIGMGERSGNVALTDVMVSLLEDARHMVEVFDNWEKASHIARLAVGDSLWHSRAIDKTMLDSLDKWHRAAASIGEIYGTTASRFHKTSLGNPEAYSAGSGPHAQANQEALKDPISKPLWKNYGRIALLHAMMGRPEAQQVIEVNAARYRQITLDTHAAGGSTRRVLEQEIVECSERERQIAVRHAQVMMHNILNIAGDPTEWLYRRSETPSERPDNSSVPAFSRA